MDTYKSPKQVQWSPKVTVTDTLDLVPRLIYSLDEHINTINNLTQIQKILIDDYQFITMNEFDKITQDKYVIIKDNIVYINNVKIVPVPKMQLYNGTYFTNYEIKNQLPNNDSVGIISHNIPIVGLEQVLKTVNTCKTTIIHQKIKEKYNNIIFKSHINNNCASEILALPQNIVIVYNSLKSLNKGGSFYISLNYYYHTPCVQLLQYILSHFDHVIHIPNVLTKNKMDSLLKYVNFDGDKPIELKQIIKSYVKTNTKLMIDK